VVRLGLEHLPHGAHRFAGLRFHAQSEQLVVEQLALVERRQRRHGQQQVALRHRVRILPRGDSLEPHQQPPLEAARRFHCHDDGLLIQLAVLVTEQQLAAGGKHVVGTVGERPTNSSPLVPCAFVM
jgi:hypothetical protein